MQAWSAGSATAEGGYTAVDALAAATSCSARCSPVVATETPASGVLIATARDECPVRNAAVRAANANRRLLHRSLDLPGGDDHILPHGVGKVSVPTPVVSWRGL
jgi:hypothetical protein